MKFAVDLDVACEGKQELKECADELTQGLMVIPSVVTMQGPAAGWPVLRFASDSVVALQQVLDRFFEDQEDADWAKGSMIFEI